MIFNIPEVNLNKVTAVVLTARIQDWDNNLPYFWKYLSKKEKEQAQKFINNDLTNKYIVSHGLLKIILSIYTKIHPENICYKFNPFSKPYLLHNSGVEFNMSHSKDYVAYIISLRRPVGIDIEWKDPTLNIKALKDMILNKQEVNYLEDVNVHNKLDKFYSIWVKKEAIIKAIGQGCNYDIKNIDVTSNNSISYPYHLYQRNKFYYSTLENVKEYAMAISILNNTTNMIYYCEL